MCWKSRADTYTWNTVALVGNSSFQRLRRKLCQSNEGDGTASKRAYQHVGIVFSIKHPLFAALVRHSEWILNHSVRNDFLVEVDNCVVKTSPYESHTGNPTRRSTSLLNRLLIGRRDDDDKQPRFQTAWFLGLIAGSDEVIAMHPDGVQRHHDEWLVSPLDDLESNLSEVKGRHWRR